MTSQKMEILVIHGPNLNILGKREPGIYGSRTLGEINEIIRKKADELGCKVDIFQSNHEGEIIDRISDSSADALIINPGGLTHTSVSLLDSLRAFRGKVVEVHLSNIMGREKFRERSLTAAGADGIISGFKHRSYTLALEAIVDK